MRLIILGAPGSGKGTQSHRLALEYGICYLSTGDILRKEIKEDSVLGQKVASFLSGGLLVPDDIVSSIVSKKIVSLGKKGFVLDGYPRTVAQANFLKDLMFSCHINLDAVIDLSINEKVLYDRIAARLICLTCGSTEIETISESSFICKKCHSSSIDRRLDDTPEIVAKRLSIYSEQTEPLLAYYQKEGCLYSVDASLKPDEVFFVIKKFLNQNENVC